MFEQLRCFASGACESAGSIYSQASATAAGAARVIALVGRCCGSSVSWLSKEEELIASILLSLAPVSSGTRNCTGGSPFAGVGSVALAESRATGAAGLATVSGCTVAPAKDGLNNSPERVSGCDHRGDPERGAPWQQRSFGSVEYEHKKVKTRRQRFLERMDGLVPWAESSSSASRPSTRSRAADAAPTRCA